MDAYRELTFDDVAWAHILFQPYSGDEYWKVVGEDPQSTAFDTNLFAFLNAWQCRITRDLQVRARIVEAVREVWRVLDPTVCGDTLAGFVKVRQSVFRKIANIGWTHKSGGRTVGATATSKILHVLRPDIFVMWDADIREAYGATDDEQGYESFMLEMARQAKNVAGSYGSTRAEAGESLEVFLCRKLGCDHPRTVTIAKLLDEYNWVAVTNEIEIPPAWHL